MVKSGGLALPLKLTVCGLPLASSAIESVAVRDPEAEGEKVTLTAQPKPTFSCPPGEHAGSAEAEKSVALAPAMLMPEKLMGTVPVFHTVTVCAALVCPT